MSYAAQADLEAAIDQQALIDLTDDEKTGAINATRLTRALADADAVIDGYLRGRYSVPLATTPPFVRHIAVSLALYGLFERRAHVLGGAPKWVADRFANAKDSLRSIRKGDLDLGVEPPPAASSAIAAEADGPDRLFTADTMKEF